MRKVNLTIDETNAGMRFDAAIAFTGLELSKRKIRAIIDMGGAYINGKRARIASRQMSRGDKVELIFNPERLSSKPRPIEPLHARAIICRTNGLILVNKPPGVPAQATKDQSVHHISTMVTELLRAAGEKIRVIEPVHRLDKETTGVMALAENKNAMTWLGEQFKNRSVEKVYWLICYGKPTKDQFEIKSFLSDIDKRSGDVSVVRSGGRLAESAFRVLARAPNENVSLLECRPRTGRSHQIRVHISTEGFPIVGDKRYGGNVQRFKVTDTLLALSSEHQLLHARSLKFRPGSDANPTTVVAELPPNFREFCTLAQIQIPR